MVFFDETEYKTETAFPRQGLSRAKGLRESGPQGCSINQQKDGGAREKRTRNKRDA